MIEKLQWDTDFFGYDVGQVIFTDDVKIDDILKEAEKFKLVYLVSGQEINYKPVRLQLVDIKTKLTKEVSIKEDCLTNNIAEYDGNNDEQLIQLALQSGIYSRFKKDQNFKHNEYERLYLRWITLSINKTLADNVIVYKEKDCYRGFITVRVKGDFPTIGLIAVEEQSRGKGIGRSLLHYVNNIIKKMELHKIEVTTQFENKPSLRLYESAGYKIVSKRYIYHIWN